MASINNLLEQLTLDEKISLLAGKNFWETVAIPRLKIPSVKVSDGPNGARGADLSGNGPTAACFTAGVNLAATFDHKLAYRVGQALAEETKTKGASVILGPTVNIHRSPRGGRNFESFSEDPLLAGNIAAQVIAGVQAAGDVGACIKHFTANEVETRRHFLDVNVDQRTLREIYMKPFEIAIKASKPWAVMSSYSLLNGIHADMHEQALRTILRNQWGFDGLIMSDWGGTNSIAPSIAAGLDLEMPGPPMQRKIDAVKAAIEKGDLKESAVSDAARNVLRLVERAGRLESPEIPSESSVVSEEHSKLIREVGGQGIVLLKNEKKLLPLSKDKLKVVAAVGLAKECLAHGGGSAMVNCHYRRTPYAALEELLPKSTELRFAKGASTLRGLPDWTEDLYDLSGEPGFTFSKYDNRDFTGDPKSVAKVNRGTLALMTELLNAATFEADFKPKLSGSHHLAINGLGTTKLFIDGELLLSQDSCDDPMGVMFGGAKELTKQYDFEAGKTYRVRLEGTSPVADPNAGPEAMVEGVFATRLSFLTQQEHDKEFLSEAVEAAKGADIVLAFVGNTSHWETEGRDQPNMNLPADGSQDALISAVAAVNSNVVAINSTGSPVAMPWLSDVSAVLQTWFGGQEAGNSMVDVLFGDVNPSGKLPVTFPKDDKFSASYENFPGDPQTDKVFYKEGIKVGYRHFDDHPDNILFPFGFGLSYTRFEIGKGTITAGNKSFNIKTNVKNVGAVDGSEVVQIYAASPVKAVEMPVKELVGYAKVAVSAGGNAETDLDIEAVKLAYWDVESDKWKVESGDYKIFIGNSATEVQEVGKFTVEQAWSFAP